MTKTQPKKPLPTQPKTTTKASTRAEPKKTPQKQPKTPINRLFYLLAAVLVLVSTVIVGVDVGIYQFNTTTRAFTETVGTVNNPGVGYTTIWAPTFYPVDYYDSSKKNPTSVPAWVKGPVVTLMINLAPFSSGQNPIQKDYPLDAQFCRDLRQVFATLRERGSTIAVRFRYDHDGHSNPEPASFEQVIDHIKTIRNSRIFDDYADIVMFVESGFVGAYGEQHSGKYTDLDHKAQLLTALLAAIPAPIPITVRTPNIYAKWAGIPLSEINTATVTKVGHERVGLFNDGYMGSSSDLGTYSNRAKETAWLHQQTKAYYGGEFSGNWGFAQEFDTYKPENALPEMYYTHLAYINGNIFSYYKEVTFDESLAIDGVDNRAYYGQTVWQFIRDHLGYRFVLQKSQMPTHARAGRTLRFNFTVTNNGFADLTHLTTAQIVLTKGDQTRTVPINLDVSGWQSTTTRKVNIAVRLPKNLSRGDWQVHLRLTVGKFDAPNPAARTVAFASNDVYQSELGANYLGTVHVN